MRFDLVDLKLFIAVADTAQHHRAARSARIWRWPPPARGSRAWKQALGVALLQARPRAASN